MGSKVQTNIMTVKSLLISLVLILELNVSNSKVATSRPTVSQSSSFSTYYPTSTSISTTSTSTPVTAITASHPTSTYPPTSSTPSTSFPTTSPLYSTTKSSFPPTSTTSFPTTSHSDQGCSNVNLSFSSGGYFPDGRITCYQENGTEFQLDYEDTSNSKEFILIEPGVSCIFLSSGHLSDGLVMEFFCDENKWRVSVIQV